MSELSVRNGKSAELSFWPISLTFNSPPLAHSSLSGISRKQSCRRNLVQTKRG